VNRGGLPGALGWRKLWGALRPGIPDAATFFNALSYPDRFEVMISHASVCRTLQREEMKCQR